MHGALAELLPRGYELWLDGAHNPAGAAMISAWADTKKDKPLYLISGMTKGRDSVAFFTPFQGKVEHIIGVTVPFEPLAKAPEAITAEAVEAGFSATAAQSLQEAIQMILDLSNGAPVRILMCGSLYLAGSMLAENERLAYSSELKTA